jgi:hypothetical protein
VLDNKRAGQQGSISGSMRTPNVDRSATRFRGHPRAGAYRFICVRKRSPPSRFEPYRSTALRALVIADGISDTHFKHGVSWDPRVTGAGQVRCWLTNAASASLSVCHAWPPTIDVIRDRADKPVRSRGPRLIPLDQRSAACRRPQRSAGPVRTRPTRHDTPSAVTSSHDQRTGWPAARPAQADREVLIRQSLPTFLSGASLEQARLPGPHVCWHWRRARNRCRHQPAPER